MRLRVGLLTSQVLPLEPIVDLVDRRIGRGEFGGGAPATDLNIDAGESNGEIDGLGHVVVRACLERLHDVCAGAVGGAHDHRQRVGR